MSKMVSEMSQKPSLEASHGRPSRLTPAFGLCFFVECSPGTRRNYAFCPSSKTQSQATSLCRIINLSQRCFFPGGIMFLEKQLSKSQHAVKAPLAFSFYPWRGLLGC